MNSNQTSLFRITERSRRQLTLFGRCLLAACGFWLVSSFDTDYQLEVKTDLILRNLPEANSKSRQAAAIEPVTLIVEGKGWSLLMLRLKPFEGTLNLDVGATLIQQVSLEGHLQELSNQLPKGLSVIDIVPKVLTVDFSTRMVKRLPIELQTDINFLPRYYYSGEVIVFPDSVSVTGPIEELDTMQTWKTTKLKFIDLSDSVRVKLNLSSVTNTDFVLNPNQTELLIPVEPFTEGLISIPLKLINNQEQYNVNLLPHKILIKYLCPVSKFQQVEEAGFSAIVDLNEWKKKHKNQLNVKLENAPDFIRIIKTEPKTIDFIISK